MTTEMTTSSIAIEVTQLSPGGSREAAERLGVSRETFDRWCQGKVRPRPRSEGELRRLLVELQSQASDKRAGAQIATRAAVHDCLSEIREALHRRGRLSSRNEALDEVASLLFAHAVAVDSGGRGVCKEVLSLPKEPASSLRDWVDDTIRRYLPQSLGHEIGASEFALRLKPQEDNLALDIIEAFERMMRVETSAGIAGPDGVDILNEVFGQFLADSFIDEKELGQYLTPPEVVTFMVRLAVRSLSDEEANALSDPLTFHNFGFVLDPSCGAGSFLSEFLREAHREFRLAGDIYSEWLRAMSENTLVGIDKSERMIRLALANLAMFGSPTANLHLENALSRTSDVTSTLEGRVGLILTNPPFGATFPRDELVGYKMAGEWTSRTPPTLDSEILFLERYLDWLRPGGQLVAIVPDSVLTNKGLFADLRKGLRNHVDVLSVTSLPHVTFASAGTSTKTSVLQLRKTKSTSRSTTQFAICNEIGFTVSTKSSKRVKQQSGPSELPVILAEMTADVPSRIVRRIDGVTAHSRWDATYHASLPQSLATRLATPDFSGVFIRDVADLIHDRVDPRRNREPLFPYIEISDVDSETGTVSAKLIATDSAPSRARQLVRTGDVLVSTVRPERKTIGVVPPTLDGSICTTGFAVLRPTHIDGQTLAILLRSPVVTMQLLRNNVGIAYPAIENACLPDILLPIQKEALSKFASKSLEVVALQAQLDKSRDELTAMIVKASPEWAMAVSGEVPDVFD